MTKELKIYLFFISLILFTNSIFYWKIRINMPSTSLDMTFMLILMGYEGIKYIGLRANQTRG